MNYQITVSGCDDSTTIEMSLSRSEHELIARVAAAITEKSTYSCMPTMSIEAVGTCIGCGGDGGYTTVTGVTFNCQRCGGSGKEPSGKAGDDGQ